MHSSTYKGITINASNSEWRSDFWIQGPRASNYFLRMALLFESKIFKKKFYVSKWGNSVYYLFEPNPTPLAFSLDSVVKSPALNWSWKLEPCDSRWQSSEASYENVLGVTFMQIQCRLSITRTRNSCFGSPIAYRLRN